MRHYRPFKALVVAGALSMAMANARTAEAVICIIHDFPIFGVVTGTQFARINAVLLPDIEQGPPCPVTLAFVDSQGNQLGGPDTFELQRGVAVHSDFIGDPGLAHSSPGADSRAGDDWRPGHLSQLRGRRPHQRRGR